MLSTVLDRIRQRTGTQDLFTRAGLSAFQAAVRTDFGNIASQWNGTIYPLLSSIAEPTGIDALVKGLAGNTLWSDVDAAAGSNSIFYSSSLGRKLTIKESLEVVATQLASLANSGGASALDKVSYVADLVKAFPEATNAQELTNVLVQGLGIFVPALMPTDGGIFYLDPATDTWVQAQADTDAHGVKQLKIGYLGEFGGPVPFAIRQGLATLPATVWSDTVPTHIGQKVYLSTATAGMVQSAVPAASGNVINVLGYVIKINGNNTFDLYVDINENYTVVP